MKFLGIIPARYGSTRLEGKPLMDIHGKPMIRHVYDRAALALDDIYVATDDRRIYDTVIEFGGKSIMTSKDHSNGTSRCLEAYEIISRNSDKHFDVIINIQGDEPLIAPEQINALKECFTDEYILMATLATKVRDPKDLNNESYAFVVFDKHNNALYFSRSVIPYLRGIPREKWHKNYEYFKHVGIYAYTPEALEIYSGLQPTALEDAEKLEQNRWLENGYSIKIGFTDHPSIPVDTQNDLDRIRKIMSK